MSRYKTFSESISTGSQSISRSRGSVSRYALPAWGKDPKLVQAVMLQFNIPENRAISLLNMLQQTPKKVSDHDKRILTKIVLTGKSVRSS